MPEETNATQEIQAVSKKNNNLIVIVLVGFVIVLLIALLIIGLAFFFFAKNKEDKDSSEKNEIHDESDSISKTTDSNKDEVKEKTPETKTGTITGFIGYPSEFLPTQKVCAETLAYKEVSCVTVQGGTSNTSYKLVIPEGSYYVYATAPGEQAYANYKSYYSKFVTCGQSVECTSHDPIEVKVTAGKIVEDVNPVDWYAE